MRSLLFTTAAAALFLIFLCSGIPGEVFFSGDGGVKTLMVRQFAAGGWHTDLRLSAEPWVTELWEGGLYPFARPFVYEIDGARYVQYPIPFMALTAPFYVVLGTLGLYVLPVLGVLLTWTGFVVLLRKLAVSPPTAALTLAGLAFATPITLYGAIYWEHAPAVGLAIAGLALAVPARPSSSVEEPSSEPLGVEDVPHPESSPESSRRFASGGTARGVAGLVAPALGGGLMGAAAWLRPESGWLAAGTFVGLWIMGRGWPATLTFGGVSGAVMAGFLALNGALYGSLLGPRARLEMDVTELHQPLEPHLTTLATLIPELISFAPVLVLVAGLALAGLARRSLRATRTQKALWMILAVFVVATPFILPNAGGKQFGPRYLLPAFPLILCLLALQLDGVRGAAAPLRRTVWILAILLLAAGVPVNAIEGTRTLHADYALRVLPALEKVRELNPDAVAVAHQWMTQEMEAALAEAPFFRVRNGEELATLVRGMRNAGRNRLLMVAWAGEGGPGPLLDLGDVAMDLTHRGQFGSYELFEGTVREGSGAGDVVGEPPGAGGVVGESSRAGGVEGGSSRAGGVVGEPR